MSDIVVRTGTLQQVASLEQQLSRQLDIYRAEIASVRGGLGFKVKSRAQIDSQLKTMVAVSEKNVGRLRSLSSVLSDAAVIYGDTEKKVVNHAKAPTSIAAALGAAGAVVNGGVSLGPAALAGVPSKGSGKKSTSKSKNNWGDLVFGALGNFGLTGGILNLVYNATQYDPKDPIKTGGKVVKSALSLVGTGAKYVGSGVAAAWSKAYTGFNFDSFNLTSGGVGAIAKWGGVVVSGIMEGYENYKEFKGDWLNPRFYAETIIETGVGVLGPMAVAAGIGAVVSGPALLIGAAGAAVFVGANWAIKAISGKDIGEWVADGVCGAVELVGKGVAQASKAVVSAAKAVGKGVGKAAKAVGKAAKSVGKSVGKAVKGIGKAISSIF